MNEQAQSHFDILMSRVPQLSVCRNQIEAAYDALMSCYAAGHKVLICGNGGSASDSDHIVCELMKGFLKKRPLSSEIKQEFHNQCGSDGDYIATHLQCGLPAISLVSQSCLISAIVNDTAGDMIYAQQVYGYGQKGDVLIAISTSGNARDVITAVHTASVVGMTVIALTGRQGGALKPLCHIPICTPAEQTWEIQEYHLAVYHALCAMVEAANFPQ